MDSKTYSEYYDIKNIDKNNEEKISIFLKQLYPEWNKNILDLIEEIDYINKRHQYKYNKTLEEKNKEKIIELLEYKTSELIFNSKWEILAIINHIWKKN